MRGIAAHVDAFLGTWGSSGAERAASVSDDSALKVLSGTAEAPAAPQSQTTPTPPPHRRLAKSFSVAPTSSLSSSSTNTSLKGNLSAFWGILVAHLKNLNYFKSNEDYLNFLKNSFSVELGF